MTTKYFCDVCGSENTISLRDREFDLIGDRVARIEIGDRKNGMFLTEGHDLCIACLAKDAKTVAAVLVKLAEDQG